LFSNLIGQPVGAELARHEEETSVTQIDDAIHIARFDCVLIAQGLGQGDLSALRNLNRWLDSFQFS